MRRRSSLVVLLCVLGATGPLGAQEWRPFGSTAQDEYREAFEALLANPTSEDAMVRYARTAATAGNLEAAVATLERTLNLYPGLVRARLELAVLYARLGAREVARIHAEQVLTTEGLPADVRTEARRFLAALHRGDTLGLLSGSITIGGRYQTNANVGVSSSRVRDAGFDVPVDEDREEEDDVDANVLAVVRHVLDLPSATRLRLDTRVQTFWSFHADVQEADLGLLEVSSGPSFQIFPTVVDDLTVRPFGLGGFAVLEQELRNHFFGGGGEIDKRIDPNLAVGAVASSRRQDFRLEEDRTGWRHRFDLHGTTTLREDLAVSAGGWIATETAGEQFRENDEYGAWIRGTFGYAAPLPLGSWPWRISGEVRWTGTRFAEPDDRIDPFVTRDDDEILLVARHTFQLLAAFALYVEVEYVHAGSNLSTGEFTNTAATGGAIWRF